MEQHTKNDATVAISTPTEFAEIATICVASKGLIGENHVLTVDGRALHKGLEVGRDFTTWAKARIEQLGFVEGLDYEEILLPKTGEQVKHGGHNAKDYLFTLDAAKHIAMVEKNARGHLIRSYFIWLEKQAQKPLKALTPRKKRAKPVDVAFRQLRNIAALIPHLDENQRLLAADRGTFNLCGISPLSEMGLASLPAPANEGHMTVTALGKLLGNMSGQAVNRLLLELGYQTKNEGAGSADLKWLPTEKGKGLSRVFEEVRKGGRGSQQVLKWSPSLQDQLQAHLTSQKGEVA